MPQSLIKSVLKCKGNKAYIIPRIFTSNIDGCSGLKLFSIRRKELYERDFELWRKRKIIPDTIYRMAPGFLNGSNKRI